MSILNKISQLDGSVAQDSDSIDTFVAGSDLSMTSRYMNDEDSFATVLYNIAKNDFGDEINEWELETLTISLKEKYPEMPDVNLDKIMAILAMNNSFDGSLCFYNEVNCFRNTINAFNGVDPDYEFFGGLFPQHICWGVYEMDQLYPGYKLDEEPAVFMATCFKEVGYLVLPEPLQEYQSILDGINYNTALVAKVKEEWDRFRNNTPEEFKGNGIIEMQLLLLKASDMYFEHQKAQYLKDLVYYK